MKVDLRGLGERAPAEPLPPALLDPAGPEIVLGGHDAFDGPLAPSAVRMYGPRAALLVGEDGPLWISDTGHHRVLGYRKRPLHDGAPADIVLGQPDFQSEGRNRSLSSPRADTVDMPVGITALPGGGLAIADSWNNRVLIYRTAPTQSGALPDIVLGQQSFEEGSPNRGRDTPRADTMHWPFAVLVHDGRMYVADAGNRRVLVFLTIPTQSGAPADLVLGQPTLDERSDNGGGEADARSMRWPHELSIVGGDLAVADAGNNRILVWDGIPQESNVPARVVLGQKDFAGVDHNAGTYDPTSRSLNMPYGMAVSGGTLLVADTANSRLVGFRTPLGTYAPAVSLAAQDAFTKKGDNRWKLPVRDSLCWPYGLTVQGNTVTIADTGNHRVLLWKLAKDAAPQSVARA
jgi:DNA-binding beta-propeller fold protein YncE